MKKALLVLVLILALIAPAAALAGGSSASTACKTRYPIVFAHGMGFSAQILGMTDYWYGIPSALRGQGAKVYVTSVNAMDGTTAKATSFKRQALDILAASGAAKINIINHSHGALYSRLAMTNMGLGSRLASWTSMSGVNHGSAMADLLVGGTLPSWLVAAGSSVIDFVYAFIMGDTDPNVLQNGLDLTRDYVNNVFNPATPNVAGVYYQSYAAAARYSCPSVVLEATWIAMLAMEGQNDGMVSVTSSKWGNFRGVQNGAWWSPGVDHCNIVGHLFGVTPGFDAPGLYVNIAKDLKARGY